MFIDQGNNSLLIEFKLLSGWLRVRRSTLATSRLQTIVRPAFQ